jgi:hypothetical protein
MSTVMLTPTPTIAPSPQCKTCFYLMPSESSRTGLRCGHQYFNSPVLMRKFLQMKHFDEVKPMNACESWKIADQSSADAATGTR